MLSSFKSKIGNVFCPIHLWGFSNGVVGRQRRLPKVVSDLLSPISVRMRSVTLIAPVSAVAVGPVRIPSPTWVPSNLGWGLPNRSVRWRRPMPDSGWEIVPWLRLIPAGWSSLGWLKIRFCRPLDRCQLLCKNHNGIALKTGFYALWFRSRRWDQSQWYRCRY